MNKQNKEASLKVGNTLAESCRAAAKFIAEARGWKLAPEFRDTDDVDDYDGPKVLGASNGQASAEWRNSTELRLADQLLGECKKWSECVARNAKFGRAGRCRGSFPALTQLQISGLLSHPRASKYDGCTAIAMETPDKFQRFDMTRVL